MGKMIGEVNQTLICTSLTSRTRTDIMAELDAVLSKNPDAIEWRADFFEGIADTDEVVAVAREIEETSPDTTAIFTVRSRKEGGEPIPLSAEAVVELLEAVCRRTEFEYVDCELSTPAHHIRHLRSVAQETNTKIIASYHNFECTPDAGALLEKIAEAQRHQLDIAKIAVMPQKLEDVLTLFGVTLEAKKKSTIPLITISMGGYGAVSRLVGGVFGSALTFATGVSSSAPGQVPIEDVRTVVNIINKLTKVGVPDA